MAVGFQKALEGAGDDPAVKTAAAALKTAIDEYSAALAAVKAQDLTVKGLSSEINAAVNEMSTRLTGYRAFVSSRVPRGDRNNLRRQIRDVVPGNGHHKKDATTTPVAQVRSGTAAQQTAAA